ncbi:hypothetical protein CBR_g30308 [Chara braunii]|uniref:Uncharacterized protein n=1 Tax=Chara braunii TaxID=69332 RepID=A0A388JX07_CHABU|nr:hypothetical protein CBR_g30308 [Chara braunii]|eukprot:GBG62354.1 hypothetical protein CBR_g30308 [Chara braunii]
MKLPVTQMSRRAWNWSVDAPREAVMNLSWNREESTEEEEIMVLRRRCSRPNLTSRSSRACSATTSKKKMEEGLGRRVEEHEAVMISSNGVEDVAGRIGEFFGCKFLETGGLGGGRWSSHAVLAFHTQELDGVEFLRAAGHRGGGVGEGVVLNEKGCELIVGGGSYVGLIRGDVVKEVWTGGGYKHIGRSGQTGRFGEACKSAREEGDPLKEGEGGKVCDGRGGSGRSGGVEVEEVGGGVESLEERVVDDDEGGGEVEEGVVVEVGVEEVVGPDVEGGGVVVNMMMVGACCSKVVMRSERAEIMARM